MNYSASGSRSRRESKAKDNGKGKIGNKNIYTSGAWEESIYVGVDEGIANKIMILPFF